MEGFAAARDFEADLEELRETYNSGKTKEASWRRSQLKGLLSLLKEREGEIFKALKQDLGKHHIEAYRDEIGTLVKSVNYALENLKGWMSNKTAKLPIAAFPTTAELVPEPLGVVLIFSSWNFPFGLSLEPMIGAIAAGNAMVLKPSELAPACSSLLANAIHSYLDTKAIKVIQGGISVGEQLLEHKWDKIFFTAFIPLQVKAFGENSPNAGALLLPLQVKAFGENSPNAGSSRVARIVMTAAAKHLTPVTLELGGKCPAVVDSDSIYSSWDKEIAIKRILAGKFGACAGQACIGIDYILVEKKFASTLVELLKVWTKKTFGENPKESNSVAKIINKQQFLRLTNLLNDPMVKASIVHGGSFDDDNLFIEPTILVDPPLNAAIMTEEIFGPLLPIITLKKIEDSLEFIKSRPKPLAIYAYTNNEKLKTRMISETSSGSITFNDSIIQYAADTLPFGGVGESGFGSYHGKFSFDTFTHEKAVLRRSFLIEFWFRFPPWNDQKLQLFKSAYVYDYFRFVLIALGLKKSA